MTPQRYLQCTGRNIYVFYYTGVLQRLSIDAQDRGWWNRDFTGEQAISYIESAAYNPLEDYIIKNPEFLLGPAELALSAARTVGAIVLERVAPKLLAAKAVGDAWDSFLSYMKGGKQEVSRKVNERRGTTGYKSGKTWDSLTSVDSPAMQKKIGKINKQAFGGGQMRTDGEYLFRFDPSHKTGKIHMERYRKVRNNVWQGYGEIDPVTGAEIDGSIARTAHREVKW